MAVAKGKALSGTTAAAACLILPWETMSLDLDSQTELGTMIVIRLVVVRPSPPWQVICRRRRWYREEWWPTTRDSAGCLVLVLGRTDKQRTVRLTRW